MILICLITLTYFVLFILTYFWFDYSLMIILSQSKPYLLQFETLNRYLVENRGDVTLLLFATLILATIIQIYVLIKPKIRTKHLLLSSLVAIILATFAYPYLSRDLFTYIFSSKIFWVYRQNPYVVIPEAFRNQDWWVALLHWTHNDYQYGPIYLIYTTIPYLFAGPNRLITLLFGTKLMNGVLFFVTGYLLLKIRKDKMAFSLWFLNPFLLVELLTNAHNELVMIFFFVLSVFLIDKKKKLLGWLSFILSVATKYVSVIYLPALLMSKKNREKYLKVVILLLLTIFPHYSPTQYWYYIWLIMALALVNLKKKTWILIYISSFLLFVHKYFSFIRFGNWNSSVFSETLSVYFILFPLIVYLVETDTISKLLKKRSNWEV